MSQTRWGRLRDEVLRIRYRLLLVNILIVSVPLVGIGFARIYEREALRALEEDMVHQAEVLRQVLAKDPAPLATRGPMLVAIARQTRARLRLLDATGAPVADSHEGGPPEGRDEHVPGYPGQRTATPPPEVPLANRPALDLPSRPEVRQALAGRYGASTRVWRFEGGERVYLFSAVPIFDGGKVTGVVYVTRSTVPVLAALYRLRRTLITVLFSALAATAVLSLFLAATIARPLSRLARIARRIAAGDRGASLALGRRDEIGHVARAFDALARQLDARAQAAARLAADISHEFKSPLTSIRGAAELLLEGAADDPAARRRFLGNILKDSDRLDRLVSRLLELSRLEADEGPFEEIDLRELVEANAPGATLTCHADHPVVRGRPAPLASAVRNLVENAHQHAAAGTSVTVTIEEPSNDVLRLAVHNHGDPISAANLSRIWDRFFTTRAASGGSGLGLPIVAAAVAAHGGRTFVTSTPDRGTTFGFDLSHG
jgi:two-component system, OmpR family, sensor histidine kinase ChvG